MKASEQQFLVVPKSRKQVDVLLDFLRFVDNRSDVSVERIVGDSSNPRRVIIRGTEDALKDLQSQFADHLINEPDSELQY